MLAAVVAKFLQFALRARQRVVGGAVLEPGRGAADPFQQLWNRRKFSPDNLFYNISSII